MSNATAPTPRNFDGDRVSVRLSRFMCEEAAHKLEVMEEGIEDDTGAARPGSMAHHYGLTAATHGALSDALDAIYRTRAASFLVPLTLRHAVVLFGELGNAADIAEDNASYSDDDNLYARDARRLREAQRRIAEAFDGVERFAAKGIPAPVAAAPVATHAPGSHEEAATDSAIVCGMLCLSSSLSQTDATPSDTRTVNRAIKRAGVRAELVQGAGYLYFSGDDIDDARTSASVPVCYVSHMRVGQWLRELGERLSDEARARLHMPAHPSARMAASIARTLSATDAADVPAEAVAVQRARDTGSAATLERAPRLSIDALLYPEAPHTPHARGIGERFIFWNLCRHLAAFGWSPHIIDDGDTRTRVRNDARSAAELLFNLDEARAVFIDASGNRHAVALVLGNSPAELVADYGFTDGDADGFAAAMEAFDAERVHAAGLAMSAAGMLADWSNA